MNGALEQLVAARALRAKALELAIPPDHAAREQHRAARTIAFLEHHHRRALLGRVRGGAKAGHAGPGDDQVRGAQTREKLSLCSTYSSFRRSGPQTKTA